MKKFIFIKNFGKYGKKRIVIWANNKNEAWELLAVEVIDTTDYLL